MNTFRTIEHLAICATKAAIEARQDPLLMGLTYRFETRPVESREFSKMEDRIEERLALMASTAKWVTRFGLV